jgi:hypothetical protein
MIFVRILYNLSNRNTMRKSLLIAIALFSGIVANSQSYEWVIGPDNDFQIFFNCDNIEYEPMQMELSDGIFEYQLWTCTTVLGDSQSVMSSEVGSSELVGVTAKQFLKQEAASCERDFNRPTRESLEETSVEGYPAVIGRAYNEDDLMYMIYELVLANNRLYEIRMDFLLAYPNDEEINAFFGTFSFDVDPDRPAPEFIEPDIDWEYLYALLEEPEGGLSNYGIFSIDFPESPLVESQMLESAAGPLELVTYICEQGVNTAFMVATTDYGLGPIDNELAQVLLQAGKTSALENLGIMNIDIERELAKKTHPGLYFKGHNDTNFVVYEMYLVNGVLFQVSILSNYAYPTSEVSDKFFSSFILN